jgi:Flp pilus assembly protein TadG
MFGEHLTRSLRGFGSHTQGNAAVIFALLLVPMVGAVGAAVDYSQANSMKSSMQAATDATALGLLSQASSLTSAQLNSTATSRFTANFNRPATNVTVSASYSSQSGVVTVNASASSATTFLGSMGIRSVAVSTVSKASMAQKIWPVCVMITNPTDGHTLLTTDTSQIKFNNCMVQVNTDNWDAVQANDTSSMTGTNSDNCFVGDIHYGNITPAKDPSCTMFPDPFAGYTMPASALSCNYGNPPPGSTKASGNKGMPAAGTTTYSPGTYCGNVNISPPPGSTVTLNPGLYIVNAGTLTMKGSSSAPVTVNAQGVTFLMTGNNAGFNLQNVKLNMTPDTTDAGNFNGFLFFLDQSNCGSKGCNYLNSSTMNYVQMTSSGIIYLVGQQFEIDNLKGTLASNITLNTGALIADMLLPQNSAVLNITGQVNSGTSAQIALQKANATGNRPVLVQ